MEPERKRAVGMFWLRMAGGILMATGAGILGYYLVDVVQLSFSHMSGWYIERLRPFMTAGAVLIILGILAYREGNRRTY
jgi:hypothetical protein